MISWCAGFQERNTLTNGEERISHDWISEGKFLADSDVDIFPVSVYWVITLQRWTGREGDFR